MEKGNKVINNLSNTKISLKKLKEKQKSINIFFFHFVASLCLPVYVCHHVQPVYRKVFKGPCCYHIFCKFIRTDKNVMLNVIV